MRCQGHKYGTGCMKTSSYPDAENWKMFQMCYGCAKKLHPEFYATKPDHGVGDNRLNARVYADMITVPNIK